MIKSLRKRHLQIWLTLAVLLPVGIVSAWLAVPQPVKEHLLQPASAQALPIMLKTTEKPNYTVNLRSSADTSSLQLEWINKSASTAPSAIIYKIPEQNSKIEQAEIIGRIDSRGIYHFPLKKDRAGESMHFVLYDIIHHRIIDLINF